MKPHFKGKTEVCVLTFHILRMWENPYLQYTCVTTCRRALFEISLWALFCNDDNIMAVTRVHDFVALSPEILIF